MVNLILAFTSFYRCLFTLQVFSNRTTWTASIFVSLHLFPYFLLSMWIFFRLFRPHWNADLKISNVVTFCSLLVTSECLSDSNWLNAWMLFSCSLIHSYNSFRALVIHSPLVIFSDSPASRVFNSNRLFSQLYFILSSIFSCKLLNQFQPCTFIYHRHHHHHHHRHHHHHHYPQSPHAVVIVINPMMILTFTKGMHASN